MRLIYLFVFVFFAIFQSFSQPLPTPKEKVSEGLVNKENWKQNSLIKNLTFENIGPTIMSGRVTDLAVNPKNPIEFYASYASGGLWYTNNNGNSFSPVLDNSNTQNIGDIAVDWNSNTIWVGTGENNSSRSSYAGIGILKSTDGGETWKNMGLKDTHHIGRILINPNNADEVIVAATGHLYSNNNERGIYKTTDGGVSWKKTLFISDQTGIIDMQTSPENFNILYAAAWDKDRKSWHFKGSGVESGIYKSTDAGSSWEKITSGNNGFPIDEGTGRIGIAVYNNNRVYAIVDNQNRRPIENDDDSNKLSKNEFKNINTADFLKLDNDKLNSFLRSHNFPRKYKAKDIKLKVKKNKIEPKDLALYLEDANSLLFDTPVIGPEIYKSVDGGKSWTKQNKEYLDDIYYSYGYYFGHIYVAPQNENKIYIYGVPILKSDDGGKSFRSMMKPNVHADHHALWMNPNKEGHLINGNDGGINITYDDGENWIKNNSPTVGQFYAINVDNQKPYNVYGGLQDNGVWVGAHTYKQSSTWQQEGQYPYQRIMGGDGMQIQIDSRNPNLVYTGYQFGNYFRINRKKNKTVPIQPKHKLGESPYRFNWQTPILLSKHNQDILYFGANKLMRSLNKGNDWEAISPDLTMGGKKGNVPYGTLSAISESPLQFGLLYTGSDDGLVHVSKDGGSEWNNISQTLPSHMWVSRVVASAHKKERVYVSLNGYRWDHFEPYIYVSENYGQSWERIGPNIPLSPVNVIVEDPVNQNILYVGTDNGLYISLDRGQNWQAASKNIPSVAIHDLVVQPDAKDLVVGTHGRSIYRVNVSQLQNFDKNLLQSKITLFKVKEVKHRKNWGNSWSKWLKAYEPKIQIPYFSNAVTSYQLKIKSEEGKVLYTRNIEAEKGYNWANYDLTVFEKNTKYLKDSKGKKEDIKKAKNNQFYLPKGSYMIQIGKAQTTLIVK